MTPNRPVNPAQPDPHQLLGLEPGATIEQVNTAYRRALRRTHPDTAPGHPNHDLPGPAPASLHQLQTARAHLLAVSPERLGRLTTTPGTATDHPASAPTAPYPTPPYPTPPCRTQAATPPTRTRPDLYAPDPAHRRDLIAGPVRYHGPTRHQ
jgi:hypothetical protein